MGTLKPLVLEFKEVEIWAFAKIKLYFSITYVKIILFKVLKKAYPIDFVRLMFTKAQKISLLISVVYMPSGNRWDRGLSKKRWFSR